MALRSGFYRAAILRGMARILAFLRQRCWPLIGRKSLVKGHKGQCHGSMRNWSWVRDQPDRARLMWGLPLFWASTTTGGRSACMDIQDVVVLLTVCERMVKIEGWRMRLSSRFQGQGSKLGKAGDHRPAEKRRGGHSLQSGDGMPRRAFRTARPMVAAMHPKYRIAERWVRRDGTHV